MKRILVITGCIAVAGALFIADASARKAVRTPPPQVQHSTSTTVGMDVRADRSLRRAVAGADTTILGFWDFDAGPACDEQGWTQHDGTAQIMEFFHVDDFAGLNGGSFGRLVPLEGSKSLWCGARPSQDAWC